MLDLLINVSIIAFILVGVVSLLGALVEGSFGAVLYLLSEGRWRISIPLIILAAVLAYFYDWVILICLGSILPVSSFLFYRALAKHQVKGRFGRYFVGIGLGLVFWGCVVSGLGYSRQRHGFYIFSWVTRVPNGWHTFGDVTGIAGGSLLAMGFLVGLVSGLSSWIREQRALDAQSKPHESKDSAEKLPLL